MPKKMLDATPITTVHAPDGSGVRLLGEDAVREGWIDRQFRLTADLLHLRMRVASSHETGAGGLGAAWAHAVVERLEALKDALYEVSADALAPPMAPLLTPVAAFVQETWAIYAWSEGIAASLVARLRLEAAEDARALLPPMNAMAGAVAELERVLGAGHGLLPRAREHLAEAYMLALGIETEVAAAYVRVTKSDVVPKA